METTPLAFSEEKLKEAGKIIARYPEGKQKSAVIPLLHMAQEEFGWCSVEAMDYIARLLHIQPIEVYEVASFYSMFNLKPVGKVVLEVCRTGPCALVGSDQLISQIEDKIGCKAGETSPDGAFTLKTVECLGACGYGPMLQVGKNYYEFLTEEKLDMLLEEFRQGRFPVQESKREFSK
jgi:NADH-quinone oxidoreductase subunit E